MYRRQTLAFSMKLGPALILQLRRSARRILSLILNFPCQPVAAIRWRKKRT